ncbi:MAG: glycosyltransferase [Pyrinomonadaceae bacterium]
MKVGFLAGTLGRGGAERQLVYMLQALQNEGIQTRVLCLTKGEAFEKEIRDLGIDIDFVGSSQNNFIRLGNIILNIKKNSLDIIQSAHFFTNFYTAAAGRLLGIHNIGAIRSDMKNEIASNGFFASWQLQLPRTLIANSQIAIDRAIRKGIDPLKIDLVRNAVGQENGKYNSEPKNENGVRILFAGRLVTQKRPELFVEMAAQLLQLLPDKKLEFIIAGDGPLRPDLERLAQDYQIGEPNFSFLGERDEMSEIYRSSDILVLTSEHEGTPNVVLEAMEFGLPSVATRVGGVPEVINDRCGILVDPANIYELVAATKKLILDKELRQKLGSAGQEYVRKNHSIGYLQKRLVDIYSKLMSSPISENKRGAVRNLDQTA